MIKIGSLKIDGGHGCVPRSRQTVKDHLRSLAKTLDLRLYFVTRKEDSKSYTMVQEAKAIVCEGTHNEGVLNKYWLIHSSLHEMVHWIQYNEGMFKNYYPRPYYGDWAWPPRQAALRVALRAERHCDFWARRMSMEFFGFSLAHGCSMYDDDNAAKWLREYHSQDELQADASPTGALHRCCLGRSRQYVGTSFLVSREGQS